MALRPIRAAQIAVRHDTRAAAHTSSCASVISKPERYRSPSRTSPSTVFLGQPRLHNSTAGVGREGVGGCAAGGASDSVEGRRRRRRHARLAEGPPPAYLTIDTRSAFFSAGGAISASVVPAACAGWARSARGTCVPRGARAPAAGLAAKQRCMSPQYVYEWEGAMRHEMVKTEVGWRLCWS